MKKLLLGLSLVSFFGHAFTYEHRLSEIKFGLSRTFDKPIIITASSHPTTKESNLTVTVYSSKDGNEWGEPTEKKFKIEEKDFLELARLFEQIDFAKVFKDYPPAGLDGSIWTFSADRWGSSVSYSFWSPRGEKGTEKMVELAKRMIAMAKLEIDDTNLY